MFVSMLQRQSYVRQKLQPHSYQLPCKSSGTARNIIAPYVIFRKVVGPSVQKEMTRSKEERFISMWS
jgi:hypothetical protein